MRKKILKIKQKTGKNFLNFCQTFLKTESGLATIEYAIVMIAAATLAGVLILIVKSDAVHAALQNLITGALQVK